MSFFVSFWLEMGQMSEQITQREEAGITVTGEPNPDSFS